MKRTRLDRVIPGVGRLTARCPSAEERKKWDALLTKLYETGRLEILRQLKAGTLSFREVLDLERRDQLQYAADNIVLARPLWEAVGMAPEGTLTGKGWLARAGKAPATRVRYGTAWRSILRAGVLSPHAQVRDLQAVDWTGLRGKLSHMGPTGWNHIRRSVSAFLTAQLGGKLKGKYHRFRLDIMAVFDDEEEPETRTPDLTIERFWEVLAHVPEPLRPCYVTMSAGGLGPGEYLRCQEHDLMPLTRGLKVTGTKKGRKKVQVIYFGLRAWEWVRQAIPCPVCYDTLLDTWQRACAAAGQADNRLYDLRHCCAQWATDAGVPVSRLRPHMRHKTLSMTDNYAQTHNKGEVADTLDVAMFGPRVVNG